MVQYYTPVSEADYMTPRPKGSGRSLAHRLRYSFGTRTPGIKSLVIPGGGLGGGIAKGFGFGKRILQRATTNPFAQMTPKQAVGRFLRKGASTIIGAGIGIPAVYSAVSGEPFRIPKLRTLALAGLGGGILPSAVTGAVAGVGLARRVGGDIARGAGRLYTEFKGPWQTPLPSGKVVDFQSPWGTVPRADVRGGDISIMTPAPASSSTVFAPSISAGGGGGMDPTLALALLGGAGLLGYGVGRRRRRKKKKRKSKKRRYY